MVAPSSNFFHKSENKAWCHLYWFYYQEKDIYTILVSKLQKLWGATANRNVDVVEIFLKSPNVHYIGCTVSRSGIQFDSLQIHENNNTFPNFLFLVQNTCVSFHKDS